MAATEYTSVGELAEFISSSGTFSDGELGLAVLAASRGIDGHCRRRFYLDAAATARTFYPLSSDVCHIDDAATITTVKTDAGDDGTYETTWTVATDWYSMPLNGIGANGMSGWPITAIRSTGTKTFPCYGTYRASVQVTATWGWASIPDEVKIACLIAAKDLWSTKDERGGLIAVGDFVAAARRNPAVLTLLIPYTRSRVLVA